jgi:ketosteroid isomerase-like protein
MQEDKRELEIVHEREQALYTALTTSDPDMFEDILSKDVTYIHSTGIAETKAENIAGQRHGVHKHGPITPHDRRTRIIGNVAVTRGMIDMVDTAHGAPYTFRLLETLVWIKEEDGVWRLLVRHATRLPL